MLLLALALGTSFIFLVPPWQHYDEPTQFEYSWLIANQPGLPGEGDYDQQVRREIASSMVEHGFFRVLDFEPDLLSSVQPVWIGISQIGTQPLYYWFAALPLRLIEHTDVTLQLYVTRFISLAFYLVTITAAYGFAAELAPSKHPLRWLLPLTILLLPGFIDILTAVNDDAAATALFSLFLWSGTRLLVKGFNGWRVLAVISLALVCFFTKSTVMVALPIALIPLLFSFFQQGRKRTAWIVLTAAGLAGILLLLDFGSPRNWYRESGNGISHAEANQSTPVGESVFVLEVSQDAPSLQVSQLIPDGGTQGTGKKTYTVGAWIWADREAQVRTPVLHTTNKKISERVDVTIEPQFFSFTETIGAQARPYKISLNLSTQLAGEPVRVYYDGIVLVEGDYQGSVPVYQDASGKYGTWSGEDFSNLVRNPSAESSGISLRPWVAEALREIIPGNPGLSLGLIFDPAPFASYYRSTVKLLFHTFWARFGWGQVTLAGYRPYLLLGILTLAGLAGAAAAFWKRRRKIRWDIFTFLGIALVALWGAALLRGIPSHIDGGYFIPVARYAYPAILPTMLVLNIGWLEIMRWIDEHAKIPRRYQLWVLIGLFVLLDILSMYSIYNFFTT